jgi:hypothetical protein
VEAQGLDHQIGAGFGITGFDPHAVDSGAVLIKGCCSACYFKVCWSMSWGSCGAEAEVCCRYRGRSSGRRCVGFFIARDAAVSFYFNDGGCACSAEQLIDYFVKKVFLFMMPEFMRVLEYIIDVLHAGLAVSRNRDVGNWVNGGECRLQLLLL